MFGIDDAILGAGLSFGGKLISGLGARSSAKSQQRRAAAETYMQNLNSSAYGSIMQSEAKSGEYGTANLVIDAQRLGFNPVTYLNSGMPSTLAGIRADLWKTGQQMKVPGKTEAIAIPSVGQAIGSAVTAAADSYSESVQAQAKVAAQGDMMRSILASVQKARSGGNAMAGLGTPAFHMSGPVLTGGGAAAALSIGRAKSLKDAGIGDKTHTDISGGGAGFVSDMSEPDADVYFKREGWLGGLVPSAATNVADLYAWGANKMGYPNQRLGSDFAIGWNWLSQTPLDPNPTRGDPPVRDNSWHWPTSARDYGFGTWWGTGMPNPFTKLPPASGGYVPSYGD